MNNLEKFDLQKALEGAELITRDGKKVTDWHYFKTDEDKYPIVAVIDGGRKIFTVDGKFLLEGNHHYDLFIKPKVKEFWVNVYRRESGTIWLGSACNSQEEANSRRLSYNISGYLKTIRVTDELE